MDLLVADILEDKSINYLFEHAVIADPCQF